MGSGYSSEEEQETQVQSKSSLVSFIKDSFSGHETIIDRYGGST